MDHAGVAKKKTYYDIIAGLSAFEKSHEVVLTAEELLELTAAEGKEEGKEEDKEEGEERQSMVHKHNKKRLNVHAYLGGKVNFNEANDKSKALTNFDLSHTLLGGYVPKAQLESLSSIDFADYFHKALECEDSLQIYDLFVQPSQNKMHMMLLDRTAQNNTNERNTQGNAGPSEEDLQSTDPRRNPRIYQWTTSEGKTIRKVVTCRRCHARFLGSQRMKQLGQHRCRE